MDLVSEVLKGNRLALARLLTQVENDTPEGREALNRLFPYTGRTHLVGVTGAPGTGKSSLVNQLALAYRKPRSGAEAIRVIRVAIVAVDPSSPFTGGAVLGDRIRMRELSGDPGVFIRSMASRGALGGIAVATSGVVQVFDAAGFELVLIETVGAGQAEVDIARLAHTTIVVEAPGLGDDIQAIKAGILEIADILVINKADRAGVDSTEQALKNMLQLGHPAAKKFLQHGQWLEEERSIPEEDTLAMWVPPIQRTIATEGSGISDLIAKIEQHRQYLVDTGEWSRKDGQRMQTEFESLLKTALMSRWRATISEDHLSALQHDMLARRLSPHEAVQSLLSP
jgi:LAO/AO transport system kinase